MLEDNFLNKSIKIKIIEIRHHSISLFQTLKEIQI
jgi:hypothetical protein